MKSPQCQMDQNNLARVFGPTIVGHGMSEPSPTTIMRDTNTQPKVSWVLRFCGGHVNVSGSSQLLFLCQVICRLLSLPEDYWRRVLAVQTDLVSTSSSTVKTYSQEDGQGRVEYVLTQQ